MTVEVKNLLSGTQITDSEGKTTLELVEIIQRLANAVRDLEARVTALEP